MKDSIDKRFITDETLTGCFPSPDKFHERFNNLPDSTLAVSEERYRLVIKNIRQRGSSSGRPTLADLSDADYKTIIEESNGYLVLSKTLKPNKQL